jgi:hypothetical protein
MMLKRYAQSGARDGLVFALRFHNHPHEQETYSGVANTQPVVCAGKLAGQRLIFSCARAATSKAKMCDAGNFASLNPCSIVNIGFT